MIKDEACIVGVGETDFCRRPGSGMSELGIQLRASKRALEDAGLRGKEIDGILAFPNVGKSEELAANLGSDNLRFAATIHMGGAAPVASLRMAALAVTSVAANHVLIPGGWNGYSGARVRQTVANDLSSIPGGAVARECANTLNSIRRR